MKKLILILIIVHCTFLKAQNWMPVGSGLNGPLITNCMVVYNNELYVGGSFTTAGGIVALYIAKWNDNVWSSVGSGLSGPPFSMVVYNGELYVSGGFSTAGGISLPFGNSIAKWNGTNWSALDSTSYNIGASSRLFVYNNELITGFTQQAASGIPKWNGSSWSLFGAGAGTISCYQPTSYCLYGTDLYVAGTFVDTASGGAFVGVCKWNGINWTNITGAVASTPIIYSMCVYNGEMYVVGQLNSIGGITCNNIAKWNGLSWSDVPIIGYSSSWYSSLYVVNGILYLAEGWYSGMGTFYDVLKFDGINWNTASINHNGGGYDAALGEYNSKIYATGSCTGSPNIVRLNSNVGVNNIVTNNSGITISPNPFSQQTTISFNNEQKNTTIKIMDVIGKEIKTINFSGKQLIIEKGQMNPGIYFIQITDENKNTTTKKLIIN